MIKTENLVILFTDIVGFTEATSLHSREQNQRILDKHNSIVLPIVKRFHGRHIKSVGDAFLLAFTSPTDSMRCAMAIQDALHAYNLNAPMGEEIHIRIAASLGEVRVSKGDIFGEPVNVTSRIEGITPTDEIYFSEAVYLAMNKAEVPAIEIGVHELKGISKPVRVYAIPRFSNSRLVPDTTSTDSDDPRLSFPFGGMHLSATPVAQTWLRRLQQQQPNSLSTRHYVSFGAIAVSVAVLVLAGMLRHEEVITPQNSQATTSATGPRQSIVVAQPVTQQPAQAPQEAPAQTQPVAQTGSGNTAPAAIAPQNGEAVAVAPQPVAVQPAAPTAAAIAPKKPAIANIAQAKRAYRDARISKERYREIVRHLKDELDLFIRRAKIDYQQGRISKQTYRDRVESLERRYEGE